MSEPSDYKDFIYGGPWVTPPIEAPLINSAAPRNIQLRGNYKRTFAYYTLKERLPVILTKVIDHLSRTTGDKESIAAISKLKNDLVTNKKMEPLPETSDEARDWNKSLAAMDDPYFFTAVWVYSECYVYRRLHDCVRGKLDPFEKQKQDAFAQNLEAACLVSRKLNEFVNSDTNKDSIVTLLKLALWANKCDLSLTAGESAAEVVDPVKMIASLKPNLLSDDTGKIADFILSRCAALQKKIDEEEKKPADQGGEEKNPAAKGVEEKKPAAEGGEEKKEEIPTEKRKPCLSKMTFSNVVTVDIVCDNAGYELLADLCLGYFLLTKNIATRVRYHVKAIPWFVSDVTPADFTWVLQQCATTNFLRELPLKEGEEPTPSEYVGDGTPLDKDPARFITSKHLQTLGTECQRFVSEGRMVVEVDPYWTSPNLYKDMKRLRPQLYRKLQFATVALFKGDLNYRKLVGEMNWPPTTKFEQALQGFTPCPLAALRTVKAELVAGLPRGKWEELTKKDELWMTKGDYGVIQFCAKKEDPKVTDVPCPEFGETCKGVCE